VADLVTRSRLDDSDFNRGLARMRKEARDFNRRLGSEFSKVFSGAAVGAGIAAALYGIGNAVRGAFADADKVSDLAETLREMPSDLVKVGGAASLMGADFDAVVKAAVKLRVNLGKAAEGGREQAEALKIMGLSGRELSRMDLPDMIVALAGGYQRAEASGRGFLVVQDLLSRGGTELVNLLQRSPEELRELFASIMPATDAALMGMGVVADQWNLMLQNMKSRFQDWVWTTYAGWRKFAASLKASEEVGAAARERFAVEKDSGIIPEGLDKRGRVAAERALYQKIHGEEMAKWMGANAEDAGFMAEGANYRPEGMIDRAKGTLTDGGAGDDEKRRKGIERLAEAYWRAKEAREAANRSDEQNLENLLGKLAELRIRIARGIADQEETIKLRTEEQGLLKEIEDLGRKIAEQKRREEEEAGREKERAAKAREEKMGEAAKVRELALEAAIAGLKADGKEHAVEEARLRVAAAEKELEMARGSKREAEAYVALMQARSNLAQASAGLGSKSKNERIEEYMRDGMTSGEAKKKVRGEDKDARRAEARISAFRKGATEEADMVSGRDSGREYMDSHRNVSGARAFDSGAWESGSYGQSVADAAAGKGAEGASGGDANGIGQLLQAVNELKAAIVAASGGGE
jgi:uncharacterized protein YoaH (UPF0181 family)